ncbi:hypothetical protein M514_02765 [Trichuris suis]|uniref:Uncharacterized protein n=1 Tax=Trichuris suis TaxID=68888 RepID=A0A085NH13_9BILA|nr:hypothetical protein M513_02765 [Trichuris suis]KFD68759.1 hypothetical protein M514_02765 [Trichuris suis]
MITLDDVQQINPKLLEGLDINLIRHPTHLIFPPVRSQVDQASKDPGRSESDFQVARLLHLRFLTERRFHWLQVTAALLGLNISGGQVTARGGEIWLAVPSWAVPYRNKFMVRVHPLFSGGLIMYLGNSEVDLRSGKFSFCYSLVMDL